MDRNCCCCPIVGVLLVQVVLCRCVCARYGLVYMTHAGLLLPGSFTQSLRLCSECVSVCLQCCVACVLLYITAVCGVML